MQNETIDLMLRQGESFFNSGKMDEAEKCFKKIADNDQDNIEALNNIGVIAFIRSDYKKAMNYFSKALAVNDLYARSIENYSKTLVAMGKYLEGLNFIRESIKKGVMNTELLNMMGNCFIELKDIKTAYTVFEKSLSIDDTQQEIIALQEKIKHLLPNGELKNDLPNESETPDNISKNETERQDQPAIEIDSDQRIKIDFEEYHFNDMTPIDDKIEMMKYYRFSESERSRSIVNLENYESDSRAFKTLPVRNRHSGEIPVFDAFEKPQKSDAEEFFIYKFSNMLVGPGGMVLDPTQQKGFYHSAFLPVFGPWNNDRDFKCHRIEKVFPLLCPWGWSWQHFMPDLLPKLVFAKDILLDQPDIALLIDGPPRFKHFETIVREILGLSNPITYFNRRVGDPEWDEMIMADQIFYCEYSHPVFWNAPPRAVRWMRSELVPQNLPVSERDKVIIISRAPGSGCGNRVVTNEMQLLAHLADFKMKHHLNWDIIHFVPTEYSLEGTIDLFSRSVLVIGYHGGGNANFLFAPPETTVIEALSPQNPGNNFFNISGGLSHNYWAVPVTDASHYSKTIELPISKIMHILELTFS